jgi:alcohol dehydrogenase class IV
MKNFIFSVPTKVVFGNGRINEVNAHLPHGAGNILIVTDKNVSQKSGALDKIVSQFNREAIHVFDAVEENPSLDLIKKAARLAREKDIGIVMGLGGGSSMDAAKGCAVLAANSGEMSDYIKGKSLENNPLPVVCVPTSSGSGSEVTPYAVFTNHENRAKECLSHPGIFPRVSIVDPELTLSVPGSVAINTGLDALIHSIEAYLSTESYALNDLLALHAIETILKHLSAASQKDRDAVSHMSYAAMLAGIAITHAGTILLHIMAYPLTIFHKVPHGKANAVLLPAFLVYMKENSFIKEKVIRLESIFEPVGGVKRFVNGLGISTRLSDYGIEQSQFRGFVQMTIIKDDVAITPADVTEAGILSIYRSAWKDEM